MTSHRQRPSLSAQVRPRLWLAGAGLLLGLGCGPLGGCHSPQGTASVREPKAKADAAEAAGARTVVTSPPPGPSPVLNDEAKAARLFAQRVALGERAPLLEDLEGQPFPSLAPLAGADALVQPAGFGAPMVAGSNLDALPGSRGTGIDGTAAAPAVNGNLLGNFILLDGKGAAGLDHFHEALRRLKEGKDEDGKVRVAMYGASHTAADIYPSYLRAYLQSRFGDGGHGYVAVVRPSKFYRPMAMTVESSRGWKVEHAQTREGRADGYYGLMGASAATSKKRSYGRVIPAELDRKSSGEKTHYDLYYLRQPGGGRFKLSVDGKVIATISTKAKEVVPGYHALAREAGPHTVQIEPLGDGEVRLFGMTIENDQPGVVVDTLGIGGTRASNQLKWNEHVWSDNLRRRAPDLIVLAYGTNESVDDDQPIESYKKQLREVLARLQRAAPEASCLLVGPGDFPIKGADGGFAPRPRTGQIVEAQREISAEAGCAFWDAMQFMGGEGSMLTWTAAQPAMAQSDHLHLTRRGYARMGMALTDAIMFDYDAAAVPMPTADTELANSGPADPSPSADGVAAAGPGDRSVVASPASQP
jgi:lysophospholipase L1-like esterase